MAEMTAAKANELLILYSESPFLLTCTQSDEIAALIEQQQQQIEQLKCCGNCINWRNGNVMQCMLTYRVINSKGKCDEWQGVE